MRRSNVMVHPRACGEQMTDPARLITSLGSSPRLRGTGKFHRAHLFRQRFIPAPAGNRVFTNAFITFPPVHPRACGEQAAKLSGISERSGSSPRLRGTVESKLDQVIGHRFIPAPAGNRNPVLTAVVSPAGSSPRLRGTVQLAVGAVLDDRFIPAPAGNRNSRAISRSRSSVHPRACGEQASLIQSCSSSHGSSPRLRGTASHTGTVEV